MDRAAYAEIVDLAEFASACLDQLPLDPTTMTETQRSKFDWLSGYCSTRLLAIAETFHLEADGIREVYGPIVGDGPDYQ